MGQTMHRVGKAFPRTEVRRSAAATHGLARRRFGKEQYGRDLLCDGMARRADAELRTQGIGKAWNGRAMAKQGAAWQGRCIAWLNVATGMA